MATIRRGFTLIELLTVIAISAILLTLIVIPLFQSFNLTRQAQALSDAQSRGRELTERIAREIGNAVAVRGPGRVETTLNGSAAQVPGGSLVISLPRVTPTGNVLTPRQDVDILLPNCKLDLLNAASGSIEFDASGNPIFRDPVTGKIDPTLRNPKGQVGLPVTPGQTLVRWFIGRRDPLTPYTNPYDGLLMSRSGSRDNLYVLYRAEVQPRVLVGGVYQTNPEFFEPDPADPSGQTPLLDDPRFFEPNRSPDGSIITNDTKADRIRNWQRVARVQNELSRYDMVQTLYDRARGTVQNTNGVPEVLPLVQFRPSRMSNDAAQSQVALRLGEESDSSRGVGADVFTTQLGSWSGATVRTWPRGWNAGDANANEYLVGRADARNGLPGAPPGFSIYVFDPDTASDDYLAGREVFDVSTYDRLTATGARYPFSQALQAANVRSGWLADAKLRSLFLPYTLDSTRGKITASFGINEVGDPSVAPNPSNPDNLPEVATVDPANPDVYTPVNDPDLTGDFWADKFSYINRRFNKATQMWTQDQGANTAGIAGMDVSMLHRFIDLRVTPNADGTPSPLDPQFGFRGAIVPGSETVYGPDQTPGPNYGLTIRYLRVNGTPGPNQYRINYSDMREPDYSVWFSGSALSGFNPNTYNPQNFISAFIQPQFKAGYLQLNSDANAPLAPGAVRVSYRFQFTGDGSSTGNRTDTFAVDYDSRELMSVLLTIRNYPQSNLPNPQSVTLRATAKVRNFIR